MVGANDQIPASPQLPGSSAVPLRAVGMGAVLEEDDPFAPAELRDLVGLEGQMAADVDEEDRARLVLAHLPLEIFERHAEVVAVAVDEFHVRPRVDRRKRRRHEGIRRTEDRLASDARPLERRERRARPAVERHGLETVPRRPLPLELRGELTLRPALGIEHAIPELMEQRAVAMVEADRETRELGREVGSQHRALPYIGGLRASSETERTLNRGMSANGLPARLQPVSPASRSGRRPQAKLVAYQPLNGSSVTPSSLDWMNQPLPRYSAA